MGKVSVKTAEKIVDLQRTVDGLKARLDWLDNGREFSIVSASEHSTTPSSYALTYFNDDDEAAVNKYIATRLRKRLREDQAELKRLTL